MKQTLRNIVGGLGLLAMVSGCTGLGAVMSTSNDPRARFVGNLMYYESSHQDRMKESGAGRSEVNVYRNNKNNQNIIPDNVYKREGDYFPVPGYQWINPDNDTDLSVRKIE